MNSIFLLCWKLTCKKLLGLEWGHYYLLSMNYDSPNISYNTQHRRNLVIATENDWMNYNLSQELGHDKIEHIIERCNNPHYDCIVYKTDQIQCFGFISYIELEFTSKFKFLLQKNEAFLYDDYCFMEFRRKGLYRQVLNERCRIIKEAGYSRILTIVAPSNRPSWNAHKHWHKEQGFYWYRFRGKEYCTLKGYERINSQAL